MGEQMTDEEKKKFLKQMGYTGNCLQKDKIPIERRPQALDDKDKKPAKRLGISFRTK